MQIKFQLIDELIAIDERLHADFAAGKISDDFKLMAMRFEFHLRAYCKSRKFHYFSNKKILKQWAEFTKLFRFDNSTQDASIGLAHITIYELLQLLY